MFFLQKSSPSICGFHADAAQANLMITAFVLRHKITGAALQDLLTLLNELMPGVAPHTRYLFEQALTTVRGEMELHFYCPSCSGYIGETGEGVCRNAECQFKYDLTSCKKNGNFFIYLPLASQLRDLLENSDISLQLGRSRSYRDDVVSDIFDGSEMRKTMLEHNISDTDLTLLWNCDGVPVFESSGYSIWPLQCVVNELPPEIRKKHVLCMALWFGSSSPNMITMFTPVIEEAKMLSTQGFTWQNPITDTPATSRAFLLTSACDATARPRLKNSLQFNGKFGCDWCLHPGESVEKGAGLVRVYPFSVPEPDPRTQDKWEEDAISAKGNPVNGVRGPCQLLFLPLFNIVKGFVPDYMHCVLLGVVRQWATLWFDPQYNQCPWYLGRHTQMLDSRLLEMKPPREISRAPRSLKERKFWKATEWKSFLLYYSLFVLMGILPTKFYHHWCLLCFSLHILLQPRIPKHLIEKADLMLKKFVIDAEMLYGKQHISFNVHQLTHLASSVCNWGPLWAASAFSFESNNRKLLSFFHGTQHVPMQIAKSFLLWRRIPNILKAANDASPTVVSYIDKLWNCSSVLPQKAFKMGIFTFFCRGVAKQLPLQHTLALKQLLGRDLQFDHGIYHSKVLIGQNLFAVEQSSQSDRRCNCVVEFCDGTFGILKHILAPKCVKCEGLCQCECSTSLMVLCSILATDSHVLFRDAQIGFSSSGFVNKVSVRNEIRAKFAKDLKRKCFLISCKDNVFVIPIVNTIESD